MTQPEAANSNEDTGANAVIITVVVIIVSVVLFLGLCTGGSGSSGTSTERDDSSEPYRRAGGAIWSGVVLYYGPAKMRVGTVLGGNSNCTDFRGDRYRGILVRMTSGSEEWKDRDVVIRGTWFVRRDDPAIDRHSWTTYPC